MTVEPPVPVVRQLRLVVEAPPTRTPWQSLNSRLDAPADLQITVFQELGAPGERAKTDAADTGHDGDV